MSVIYALCEPTGEVRYVGYAVDANARLRSHLEVARLFDVTPANVSLIHARKTWTEG